MPNTYVRELLLGEDQLANQAADAKNMETRDQSARVLTGLATVMLTPQDDILSDMTSGNRILLLAGDFPGTTIKTPDTLLQGQPGTKMTSALNLYNSARIIGIDFTGQTSTALANLTAAAFPVIFQNCTFTKRQGVGGDYVVLANGAKAVFIGCFFYGAQTSGAVVNNAGAGANCGIVGCANLTGVAHVNVTNVFEV